MRFTIAGAAVSIIAFTYIASAATSEDRPVRRAPPPQPAPATTPNWTGFYSGPNAGGGFENTIKNSATTITSLCDDPGIPLCAALTAGVPGQFDTHPSGFIGGGQIGYNWQTGVFVWGVETDLQWTNINGDKSAANTQVVPPSAVLDTPGGVVTTSGTGSQKIDWLGTVRGRLGWTPTPPVLIYATGGLAYGHVKTDVSFAGQIAITEFGAPGPFSGATTASNGETLTGWTIGGGVEWMFAPQWSIKGEYLYYDLGTVTIDQTLNTINFSDIPPTVQSSTAIHSDAHYHGSIARLGLNYYFH
jgi:outer membrane immunogenic protein